ncbi:carbon storage regulator CsrA [Prochlorococcus marinus str. MU1404]|uniref:carbon storage regulator CsrA n=1 Tax=Prochlorococcus marinus TaxID=1219 RepID=UPI001ADA5C81|nr:carbon storage regulator CsrA [Prochlorococcus marinus]MBO8230700.1 carbon storage regulator CsrA [Prochlorococcus marinus XMU1404]MBW3073738.1 carbon storage regulator CsrA [Prochlorococcus marinus str. MU1404]MCR8544968.1 carbon storage regulator CsrA [Prochlorococcus marinus CUG1432]
MFKNLLLTFFLFSCAFITIYPVKKEKINLIDYCYSLEKILSRNSLVKSKNVSEKYKTFAKDITLFGTNKTKGELVNKIIDAYKNSKKSLIINFVPNQIYCLGGYWIEQVNPGTFQTIFYEKSKQRVNQYKNIKKEVDQFIKDINSEYESIEKKINDYF